MAFSESLTIRILGDSSGLRRELDDVASQLDGLQSRFGGDGLGRELVSGLSQLEGVAQPLANIGQSIERVRSQLLSLSSTPVTLNVAPALAALQQLLMGAAQAAAQIRTLNLWSGASAQAPAAAAGPVRGFASGGLVSGPTGIDQVPARLTAGEFVLSREAVQALGTAALDRLNRMPAPQPVAARSATAGVRSLAVRDFGREAHVAGGTQISSVSQQTTNHFGGISIQVREVADSAGVLRRLQQDGIALRNRRG